MTLVEKLDLVILFLTIIAIVAGPIIAVWMTRRVDESRQAYFRRLEVYRNLMLTRSVRIAPDHVRALNLVPVEFAQFDRVVEEFKKYIEHLSSPLPAVDQQELHYAQQSDIFYELLFRIGKTLGYSFDKRDLERLSYLPKGHVDDENRNRRAQNALAEILEGKRTFPVSINQPMMSAGIFPEPPKT